MTTTVTQIDLWRQRPSEDQELEFKEAKNQFDFGKLREYCVAIANEGGGHLLFGISDIPPRPVVGSQAYPDIVKIAERLFIDIDFRVDVEEVQHPDGRVLVFHIPSRPRGTAYHLNGRYLMRSGASLVAMTEDRLRAIFSEGDGGNQHQAKERAVALLAELESSKDAWMKSWSHDHAVRQMPSQIVGIFAVAVPISRISLTVLEHPALPPVMIPMRYRAGGVHTVEWPWAGKQRSRDPTLRGERRDYIEDIYALFDRIYDDGAVGLAMINTNGQRGWIGPVRNILLHLDYLMLHLATALQTIDLVRIAASSSTTHYALYVTVETTGGVYVTIGGDHTVDEKLFHQRPFIREGATPLPQYIIRDSANFASIIGFAMRDLLHVMGVNIKHEWAIEFPVSDKARREQGDKNT